MKRIGKDGHVCWAEGREISAKLRYATATIDVGDHCVVVHRDVVPSAIEQRGMSIWAWHGNVIKNSQLRPDGGKGTWPRDGDDG
jgi:hypothetical protein